MLALIILACIATVSANTPGSSEDPLISRSYLHDQYERALRVDITNLLGGATDSAISRLDDINIDNAGYTFARRHTPVSISAGGSVALAPGASFVLLSGSAAINISNGTVINISTGREVSSNSTLTRNQRYFCTEEARAVISASSAATGHVDGYYILQGSTVTPPVTPGPLPFTDVPANAWFYPAVAFAYENTLFRGTTSTTFSPNVPMDRGMFVTVLYRLDGRPAVGTGGRFTDVRNPSAYYYDPVTWAGANGVVRGYSDGTFQPYRAISRQDMAVIMYRYAALKGHDMTASSATFDTFTDRGTVAASALDAMRWATDRGIIRGSGGRLQPLSSATRAEVAQIVLNYVERVGR